MSEQSHLWPEHCQSCTCCGPLACCSQLSGVCSARLASRAGKWVTNTGRPQFFDPATWDGSDVFFLGDDAVLVVHRRVLKVCSCSILDEQELS